MVKEPEYYDIPVFLRRESLENRQQRQLDLGSSPNEAINKAIEVISNSTTRAEMIRCCDDLDKRFLQGDESLANAEWDSLNIAIKKRLKALGLDED